MGDEDSKQPDIDLSFWDTHRFMLLVSITIMISLTLVGISMALYASSGAAQLDLSRPGYSAVKNQAVNNDKEFQNYPVTGPLDLSSVNEFRSLYQKQAIEAKTIDAFGGDPLNPDALEMSASASK